MKLTIKHTAQYTGNIIIDNEIVGCDQCVSEKEPWEADCEHKDVKL